MAADPRKFRIQQIPNQIKQPIFIRAAIRIGESNDVPGGCFNSSISRSRETAIRFVLDVTSARKLLRDLLRAIGRTVVHQKNFVVRIIQPLQRFQTRFQCPVAIITRHHHAHARRHRVRQREIRRHIKLPLHHVKGPLRLAFNRSQSERPIGHLYSLLYQSSV